MKKTNNVMIIKNINTVINDLVNKPHYKPLRNLFFCKDFLNSFPPTKRRLIAKIYVKNHILNIMTLHTAGYQELNHDDSKIYIKVLIKKYAHSYPLSGFSDINGIRIFSQRYADIGFNEKNIVKKSYIELSLGLFKNTFEHTGLSQKFEELRQVIKNG